MYIMRALCLLLVLGATHALRYEMTEPSHLSGLHNASYDGDIDSVTAMLNDTEIDLDAQQGGWTVLCLASRYGHDGVIDVLLGGDRRVDVNAPQMGRATALHAAVLGGHPAVVKTLLEAGIDATLTDVFETTALDWANHFNLTDIAETIEEHQVKRRVMAILVELLKMADGPKFLADLIELSAEKRQQRIPCEQIRELVKKQAPSIQKIVVIEVFKVPMVSMFAGPAAHQVLKLMGSNSPETLERIIDLLPLHFYGAYSLLINYALRSYFTLPSGADLSSLVSGEGGMKIDKIPSDLMENISAIMYNYVSYLPLHMKQRIAKAIIMVPGLLTDEGKIADPLIVIQTALSFAGPMMQKLWQLLGDEIDNPVIKATIATLKSGGIAMTPEQVLDALATCFTVDATEHIFESFEMQALAVGTIAEAHGAVLKSGQHVVVKLKRPGIEKLFRDELIAMGEIASDHRPELTPFVDSMAESIRQELDFTFEAKNLLLGLEYESEKGIKIGRLVQGLHGVIAEKVIIVERAAGVSLDHLDPSNLEVQLVLRDKIISFAIEWARRALLGDGFFHGDLHGGNIMYDVMTMVMTIIDFGNAPIMTPEEKSGYVQFAAALVMRDFAMFMSAIKSLSCTTFELSGAEEAKFEAEFNELYETDAISPMKRVTNAYALAMSMQRYGLKLRPSFTQFVRAAGFIDNIVCELNENINRLSPNGSPAPQINVGEVMVGITKSFICNRFKTVCGMGSCPAHERTLFHVGCQQLTSICNSYWNPASPAAHTGETQQ